MLTNRCLLALVPLLLATDVVAATRTTLTVAGVPETARYSQAINLDVTLADADGAALPGSSGCDPAPDDGTPLVCSVVVTMQPADSTDAADVITITAPDVVVDDAGRARVRITLVDGRHGDASFVTSADGTPYTITASFAGNGPRATDADCLEGASGADDGLRCPTAATATVALIPEVPALSFNQDVVLTLGESTTLFATLTDDTGNADAAGSDVDGTAPAPLVGVPVRFFYDADNNGRPAASERIGEGTTNGEGVASVTFNAVAPDVTAGVFAAGLHAEFPGDDRYALARTSVALTINSGGVPDLARTIIEITPETITPDTSATATIRVRLVDENNNIIDGNAPERDVVIASDLGRLLESVDRDLLDGSYSQQLTVPRARNTATITVTVDGEPAGERTLAIDGPDVGCNCASLGTVMPAAAALFALGRRRRRRSPTSTVGA